VIRINTVSYSTEVIDFEARWDKTAMNFITKPVRGHWFTWNIKITIPIVGDTGFPQPTPRIRLSLDLGPEAIHGLLINN
tara:strand:+ start:1304 stop:1540 length:237 start_codon:yes stop_codon:yes gene_type:complete